MRISRSITFIVGWSIALAFFVVTNPLSAMAGEGGTIKGVVKTPWVKRYQALVYIDKVEGKEVASPKENPFVSQRGLVFRPHILPILKGTTVDFTNDDNVVHNVFAPPGSVKRFNLGTYGVGVTKAVTFDKLGEVTLLCNVHSEMLGYVIVLQNPYFALTDKKGIFEIKDVPPGTYQLKVWHEKLKEATQEVVVEEGKTVSVEFKKKELKRR
jgi:plastocyanin